MKAHRAKPVVYAKAKAQARKYWYKKYGMTQSKYDVMFRNQSGKCAICEQPPRRDVLDVDHDHETNQIRGLLCDLCNRGLGQFRDSILHLRAAIRYLGG